MSSSNRSQWASGAGNFARTILAPLRQNTFTMSLAIFYLFTTVTASDTANQPTFERSHGWPFGPGMPSFQGWLFVLVAVAFSAYAFLFTKLYSKYESKVLVTSMAASTITIISITWDTILPPTVFWTLEMLGIGFSVQFVRIEGHRSGSNFTIRVLIILCLIIYSYAKYSTVVYDNTTTRERLTMVLAFFPPAFSISLLLCTYVINFWGTPVPSNVPPAQGFGDDYGAC